MLKDKLNEMIRNLRETMRQNTEQDWLKTNLERFTRMLQGQRDLATVSNMVLSELAPLVSAQHGVFYALTDPSDGGEPVLRFQAGYGFKERKHLASHLPRSARAWSASARSRRSGSCSPTSRPTTSRSTPASASRRRSTSSCCRSCSRDRCAP